MTIDSSARVHPRRRSAMITVAGLIAGATTLVSLTGSLGSPVMAADSPISERAAGHVTADALPTVQINGVVWDQEIIGDRVYAVGEFTTARPPGAAAGVGEVPRANILAYNIRTGQLDTGFNASLNAQAKAVEASPDGSRLYIGGMFTTVNGVGKSRIAALNPVTGALIPGFNAVAGYRVNSLVATNTTLYAGGQFTSANGAVARQRLAAYSTTNGALLAWAPSADNEVLGMTLTPDGSKLIVAGRFGTLNGVQARGSGALDAVSGATLPWAMNNVLTTYGADAAIYGVTTDGEAIYGTAYHYGGTSLKFEGTFSANPNTGQLNWINDCHGDSYDHTVMNGYVYTVSHAHYCSNTGGFPQPARWKDYMQHSMSVTTNATGTVRPDKWGYASFPGLPSPSTIAWSPLWDTGAYTGANQAGWTVESTDEYLLVGGEFDGVNGRTQQGLVRFAVEPIAPADQGPRFGTSRFVPTLQSEAPGHVRISFRANVDRDDSTLQYQIIRDGNAANPVHTTVVKSTFWDRPTISFVDTGVPAGTHTYRLRALDGDGNSATGSDVSVTVASSGTVSAYAAAVLADGPSFQWRFNESSGSVTDSATDMAGTAQGGVTRGQPGAIVGESSTSYRFNGSTSALVSLTSTARLPVIDTYTLETWVRTTSFTGGRILGFSGSHTTRSSDTQSDRHLYMSNNGAVYFGVRQQGNRLTVNSGAGLNDGDWHHIVATHSDKGLALYVDGQLVGSRADALVGDDYYGFWRVGYDRTQGWPSAPLSESFNGWIDEVAVYEFKALSAQRVLAHYAAGGHGPNVAPIADFSSVTDELALDVDAASSLDLDGSIVSYAWTFGDGGTGSGVSASHDYAANGTYNVKLTVTDNEGATGTVTKQVTVAETPNVAPTAAFSWSATELAAQFDAAASGDTDGTIASYAWNFDDGTTGTGVSVSHDYAANGTYDVTLTVTDNEGATGTVTKQVTVAKTPNVAPTAAFSWSATDLAAQFDAAASADADGTIASYAWNFDDGTTGTGVSATHQYATAGTYDVTLTVTDDEGATHSVTQQVTVEVIDEPVVVASDTFGRTVAGGWGAGEVGGAWVAQSGAASQFAVNGNAGTITHGPGQTRSIALPGVVATDVSATVDLSWNVAPTGGGVYEHFQLRRQGSTNYTARVRLMPTSTTITLLRTVGGTATTIATVTVPGLVYGPGAVWRLSFELEGVSPTTLRAKVWDLAGAEPAAWQLTATDSTAGLQQPGAVGIESYLSGSSTAAVVSSFDNLAVQS